MNKAKAVSPPFSFPSTKKEKEDMERVPYASAVGSLMYAMG